MVCKNVCERYRAIKPILPDTRYGMGQKRCQLCEIFVNWDGMYCPCCGYRLRANPRNSKYKEHLHEIKQVKRIWWYHDKIQTDMQELLVKSHPWDWFNGWFGRVLEKLECQVWKKYEVCAWVCVWSDKIIYFYKSDAIKKGWRGYKRK